MKRLLLVPLALVALAAWAAPLQAQSAEEFEQMMRSIEDKMGDLERLLAKTSVDPQEADALVRGLRKLLDDPQQGAIPENVEGFLKNNPELLQKYSGKTADELKKLLATEDGLQALLKKQPGILKKLVENQKDVIDALKRHSRIENDLQRLFRQTESQMQKTEEELKLLVEKASKQ